MLLIDPETARNVALRALAIAGGTGSSDQPGRIMELAAAAVNPQHYVHGNLPATFAHGAAIGVTRAARPTWARWRSVCA
jgi:hypothetical protein